MGTDMTNALGTASRIAGYLALFFAGVTAFGALVDGLRWMVGV